MQVNEKCSEIVFLSTQQVGTSSCEICGYDPDCDLDCSHDCDSCCDSECDSCCDSECDVY